jgi:hypothetical protein
MENGLKLLYVIMGIVIFIMAISLLNRLNKNFNAFQENIKNQNVDYHIIRMVD